MRGGKIRSSGLRSVALSATSAVAVEHPPRSRSRLANEPFRLPGVNGNTAEARHYRDLCLSFAAELSPDPSALSEGDRQLVQATAGLAMEAARMQAALVRGLAVNNEELTRVNNALTRNLSRLRQRRRQPRDDAPNLQEYLAGKGSAA